MGLCNRFRKLNPLIEIDLEFIMLLKGNIYLKYSPSLSYIFEFQLFSFAFSLILGDPSMMSPTPNVWGVGTIFSRKCFSLGTNF